MPSLFDTFRFTANDGTGDTSVTPLVSGLKRRWERDGENRSYRVKLTTKLVFKGADYTYFRTVYDAGDCDAVSLLIENYCGGAWADWFVGTVPIRAGEYDATRCEVAFDIAPDDVYECADRAFEKKENWLLYATPTSIKSILGTVETITCQFQQSAPFFHAEPQFAKSCWGAPDVTDNPDPDAALAWRPITGSHVYVGVGGIDYLIQTTWAREKTISVTTPPGDGWINISGTTWVRPINTSFLKVSPPTLNTISEYDVVWDSQILNPTPVSNARPLGVVLETAIEQIGCGIDQVVSNFFNINPDATAPSNDAYDYAAANFENVYFFQKSDIVRATASNDATRFEATFKEFFKELETLNVFWAIVNDGGTVKLRIEHYTYFNGANGLDLTIYDGGKYIVGLDKFKSKEQIPAFEGFAYQESFRPKFLTQRIDYPAGCVTAGSIDRSARLLCADFGGLVENPDAGLEGFFLMATHDIGGGEYLMNTLGGEANGAFAWENLLPALWADGRYHLAATATVAGYSVNSVRKSRQQGLITVKFPCSQAFEASELVQTQIGWGEVEYAEHDTETGTLRLSLLQ